MKYVLLTFIILIAGCTSKPEACKNDLNNCQLVKSGWTLRALDEDCKKLASCMKMDYEILAFQNQPHNPYACSIWKDDGKYRRGHYYYPAGRISFGEVNYDRLDSAIATCEMMTKTGDKSKEYYDRLKEVFEAMDRRKKELDEADRKASQPLPEVKVRYVK